ncbi:MAG: hypothetical protein SH857_01690 [Chitinophagales bacterium]|nr:hypothetical protein [Chitinophagales bacterium]
MKKLVPVVALFAVLSLASCKKDYVCSCTVLGITTKTTIPDTKKGDAEDACDASDTAAQVAGGSCELE